VIPEIKGKETKYRDWIMQALADGRLT